MVSNTAITEDSGEEIQVVVFSVGDELLAVGINNVREILKVPDITRVPKSPKFVEGVINLRGTITTVLNLKRKLGMKDTKAEVDGRIIIVEHNEGAFGIIVDTVIGVLRINSENITDPSSILGSENVDFIMGVGKMEDKLVILLDPGKLFSTGEMALP